jgi:hypothetical protein
MTTIADISRARQRRIPLFKGRHFPLSFGPGYFGPIPLARFPFPPGSSGPGTTPNGRGPRRDDGHVDACVQPTASIPPPWRPGSAASLPSSSTRHSTLITHHPHLGHPVRTRHARARLPTAAANYPNRPAGLDMSSRRPRPPRPYQYQAPRQVVNVALCTENGMRCSVHYLPGLPLREARSGRLPRRRPGRSAAVVEGHLVAVGVGEREGAAERPVGGR